MADYTVTFGKRGGLTAQFEPEKTLTLKNQPVDKTNLQDLNDIAPAAGDNLQNGDILVYNKESNTFVYSSGNVIRDANNQFVFIGDALVPPAGRNVNLGSPTRPFKSLFVQGNTISIGNVSLSDTGFGSLSIGQIQPDGNVIFTGDLSVVSTANLMTLGTDVGNVEFQLNDGALQTFTAQTVVTTAIDELNEAMLNVFNNTFVRNVQFSANPETGGLGTTVTLTIVTEGNPNDYDINWGDGTVELGISNSTPSHAYTDNANTPFTISVTARNTNGYGAGSNTSLTRVDYVQIFAQNPEPEFKIYSVLTGGTTISEANTGQTIYMDNDSRNIPNTDITAAYNIDWGDGSSQAITSKTNAGGDQGDRLSHVYSTDSGSGLFTLTMSINAYSSAAPGLLPLSNTQVLKVFDVGIGAPDNITSKTVTWGTSSQGTSPALASGFVANTFANTLSAGQAISSTFPRYTSGTVSTGSMSSYFHSNGSITALFNDTGNSIISATNNESGVDYYNYNAQGVAVSPVDRIFAPNLYETGIKSTISFDVSAFDFGVNKIEFETDEGNSNELLYVYDNLTSAPTVNVSGASITEKTVSYNYISGIPYYNSDDVLTVSGVTVQNITGQTYYNQSNPFRITASNFGGSTGTGVAAQSYDYSVALSASDRDGNIPVANLTSANIEDLDVNISTGDRIVRLNFNATTVNGTDSEQVSDTRIQIFNGNDVINETAIPVADDLGINYATDGVRITGFSGATPTFSPTTDYYDDNAWSEPATVAGTDEAIVRYGSLQHFNEDLSSDYLPVGPDLETGRLGTQFFRLAFKRAAVSNIRVRLSGKISGFYVALPGTAIDSASTLNGWLTASVQYAGSGVPGADTGNGGNGSNGCAFTGADRILDGVTYNNQTFDLTFGTESTTNSFQNQVLVAIALNSDDSLTSISFEDAS